MTQEQCAKTGCGCYLRNIDLIQKHREDPQNFPLDTEWKNCSHGPDTWLNCKKRKQPQNPRIELKYSSVEWRNNRFDGNPEVVLTYPDGTERINSW